MKPRKPKDRFRDPPCVATWGHFAAEKVDQECARNFLLWFVHDKGLDKELLAYIDKHTPKDD